MTRIKKLSHMAVNTPDLVRMKEYYEDVLGFPAVIHDAGRDFLMTCTGKRAVVLQGGSEADCVTLSFEIPAASDMKAVVAELTAAGIAAEVRTDSDPGISEMVRFRDVKGTMIELFREPAPVEVPSAQKGVAALRLGHVAYAVTDINKAVEHYTGLFGFRVSDWMGDFFVWLRCNAEHHTVNFIRGERNGMHHHAFELADWDHFKRALDHLSLCGIKIAWAPVAMELDTTFLLITTIRMAKLSNFTLRST